MFGSGSRCGLPVLLADVHCKTRLAKAKMDEPMEEAEADTTQPDLVPEVPKRQPNPLLRPGSMVMMTITVEDYESQYWPKLEQAIDQLLTMQPGQYIPISYEQMYSCVYKCVCKQFSERLYADLMKHMKSHLFVLDKELEQSMETSTSYIHKFSFLMNQYLQALGGIVPIFNYMNRFYVETKLKTDLSQELRNLFRTVVVDKHASTILSLLEDANSKPFTVSPPTMAMLIKNLHLLNPDYAKINPALFSKYIPNVLPATSLLELDRYAEETKQMQLEIHKHPGFEGNDRSRKRRIEEEGPIK